MMLIFEVYNYNSLCTEIEMKWKIEDMRKQELHDLHS
jgi:hypothetical protein